MIGLLSRHDAASVATGRSTPLFDADVAVMESTLRSRLDGQRVLVIGGAGSIGAATVAELARYDLASLHVVDVNENGLAELIRDLRGRPEGLAVRDMRTLPLDFGSRVMWRLLQDEEPYGVVLNFAAIKHVRSEKDAYSLLHMLDTNILKADRLLGWLAARGGTQRYFCVSTDKAANPVNLMGASKRLMEHVIFSYVTRGSVTAAAPHRIAISSARFANVAFSAGSLLDGWMLRLEKGQPLAVPAGTRRYFVSLREAGQLCLLAAICAPDGTIMIPRLDDSHLVDLEDVARALLQHIGYAPVAYSVEALARTAVAREVADGRYPLLLTPLDTSGEKAYEEFVGEGEEALELGLPNLLSIRYAGVDRAALARFLAWLAPLVSGEGARPTKADFVVAVGDVVAEFRHLESGKRLDDRL